MKQPKGIVVNPRLDKNNNPVFIVTSAVGDMDDGIADIFYRFIEELEKKDSVISLHSVESEELICDRKDLPESYRQDASDKFDMNLVPVTYKKLFQNIVIKVTDKNNLPQIQPIENGTTATTPQQPAPAAV